MPSCVRFARDIKGYNRKAPREPTVLVPSLEVRSSFQERGNHLRILVAIGGGHQRGPTAIAQKIHIRAITDGGVHTL